MSDTKSSNPKDVLARGEERCLLHLIPSPGLIATAQAMADGARKYGPYNWRDEGVGATTYVSAAMRHLRSWLDGEEQADDSGVHHLGHAAACLMILLDAQAVENLVDDRPTPAPTAELLNAIKRGPDKLEFDIFSEPTLQDYPFGEAVVGGFAEHVDPERKTTARIEAIDVHEATWPMLQTEPHPDPLMAELGFGAKDAEAGPTFEEQGLCEKGLPGVGIAEQMEEARKEIRELLERANIRDPESYVVPNYGPIKVRRNQEYSHWRYDPGCDCRKCEEEEYRRRGADSPNSEPTPNPNGGVA